MFKVSYVGEEQAKQLLKEDKVSAVVKLQDPIAITVNQNGLDQTITKTFFDEYSQKIHLVEEAMQQYPDVYKRQILESWDICVCCMIIVVMAKVFAGKMIWAIWAQRKQRH